MTEIIDFRLEKALESATQEIDYQDSTEKRSNSSASFIQNCTSGTATNAQALASAQATIAASFPRDDFGNPIAKITQSETRAPGKVWKYSVKYSSKAAVPADWFDYCYEDSTSYQGETATRVRSLATRSFAATGGCVVDSGGYVNVVDGKVQGVEYGVPSQRFSIRARLKYNDAKKAYIQGLMTYHKTVNNAEFWGRPAGTVLFDSADFPLQGVSDSGDFSGAYWDGKFNFVYSPATFVNIDGASFTKGGWEYVWPFRRVVDASNGYSYQQTVCVYAEQIYPITDFSGLGLTEISAD